VSTKEEDMRHREGSALGMTGVLSAMALVLAACAGPAPAAPTAAPAAASAKAAAPAKDTTPIKIGVTMPLTGGPAEYGGNINTAIQIAAEDINARGAVNGRKLEIISEDTQADPKTAVAATRKLVTVDRVPVIITSFTGQTLAQVPVADELKTVIFANSSLPTTAAMSPWSFNTFLSTPYQAQTVSEYATQTLGFKQFGLIMCNNEACRASQERLEEAVKKAGGQFVATETFDVNATDFRTQLTKLQAAKPQGVFHLGTGGKDAGLILKQMAEMGFKTQFLGTGAAVETPDTLQIAGGAGEDILYASSQLDPSNPETARFMEAFKARTGKEPDFGQVVFYDTMQALASAMAAKGAEPEQIKAGLLALGPQKGIASDFEIKQDRTTEWKTVIKTIKGGKYVLQEAPLEASCASKGDRAAPARPARRSGQHARAGRGLDDDGRRAADRLRHSLPGYGPRARLDGCRSYRRLLDRAVRLRSARPRRGSADGSAGLAEQHAGRLRLDGARAPLAQPSDLALGSLPRLDARGGGGPGRGRLRGDVQAAIPARGRFLPEGGWGRGSWQRPGRVSDCPCPAVWRRAGWLAVVRGSQLCPHPGDPCLAGSLGGTRQSRHLTRRTSIPGR
jgi:ABC-type branched-subunit amino acid transport system substrate-binding protein